MPQEVPVNHPLRRLFNTLVETTFLRTLGLNDRDMAVYVANILAEFVHMDNVLRIRDARGRSLEQVAEMLMEGDLRLNASSFSREREVHKHIGDFTLFWTGVYPEALGILRSPSKKDHLIDYVEQGKKSYHIASTFDWDEFRNEAEVLRHLSQDFEVAMYGLNLVRQEWERMGDPMSGRVRRMLMD